MRSVRHPVVLACVLSLAAVALPVWSQTSSVRPGINLHFQNPSFKQWVQAFERPDREVYVRRQDIVDAAGIQPGMSVADVGAGTGLFTWLFAARVGPSGRVYAVDLAGNFVRNIERLARDKGLRNVYGVLNTPRDVLLPPAAIDIAFVCDTYHHFEYPQEMLRSLHRALRPGGMLIVIDFRREPGLSSPWVMGHVRAGKEVVVREIEAQGFRLDDEVDLLRESYFLKFVRK